MPPGFGLFGRFAFGVFGPRKKVLGMEMAGTIESTGRDVTRFKEGDKVFALTNAAFGCHAEYQVIAADGMIAHKPANLSFAEAAALWFGGTTALDFLRDKGGLQLGEKVLIVGASGCVGSAAVQLAKHFGAHVTGVCSTDNVDLVRSIGADAVIDYNAEDFAASGESFDIILDTTGTTSFKRCENALNKEARMLMVLSTIGQMIGLDRPPKSSGKRVIAGVAAERPEDMRFLADLASAGEFKPVIDSTFQLDDIVTAHARVDTGRKRGSVVISVVPENEN